MSDLIKSENSISKYEESSYKLTDYQGKEISVTAEQAQKIANLAEMIEIEVAGMKHYINPKNIASIKPRKRF
jgi:hypothetical protein